MQLESHGISAFVFRPSPQNPCTAHTKNTPTRIAKHREQTLQNTTLPLMFLPSFLPLLEVFVIQMFEKAKNIRHIF